MEKERQKDSKGRTTGEIYNVGKKEKQLEGWKEAKKYRIEKSNGNGRLEEKEAGHSKISCQVPEV